MLGGSSGSNFMLYVRGNKADFDTWVYKGGTGWDWDNVTYYYKKSEGNQIPEIMQGSSADLHNTKGPLGITRPLWENRTRKYLGALSENYKILTDTNGHEQLGYSMPPYTIANKVRQSTATAFLSPIKERKNLFILKGTLCTKVLIEKSRAIGVQVKLKNNKTINLYAAKEVVLSAGAINSPQLLMLSGIGPPKHLREKGIQVLVDLPQVGQNLYEHPTAQLLLTGKKGFESVRDNIDLLTNYDKLPFPFIIGHVSLSKDQPFPDYQTLGLPSSTASMMPTLICSLLFGLDDRICIAIADACKTQETLLVTIILLHPKSKGHIELRSKNPEDSPKIFLKLFSNKYDLDKHARCVEDFLIKVKNTSYFKSVNSEVIDFKVPQCAHIKFNSHEYWKCHILNTASTIWHPVGTCVMGREGKSVVDAELKVWGVDRLRIGDASIMPGITSGNTNAPCIMIGEKLADMIKRSHGVY